MRAFINNDIREYKLDRNWALFLFVFLPLLFLMLGCLVYFGVMEWKPRNWYTVGPLSFLYILVSSEVIAAKVVIDFDRIYYKSLFRRKELLFTQISGYRQEDEELYIETVYPGKKSLKFPKYFAGRDEVIEWLEKNDCQNLDQADLVNEVTEFEENEGFGSGASERWTNIEYVRRHVKAFNWTASIAGIIAIGLSLNQQVYTLIGVLIPLLMLVLVRLSNGMIRLRNKKGSIYPELFNPLLISAILVAYKTINAWKIPDYENVWPLALGFMVSWLAIASFGNTGFIFRKGEDTLHNFLLLILVYIYCYGAIVSVNVVFEKQAPKRYEVEVLGKSMDSGKRKSAYLTLAPWGPYTESQTISVHGPAYDKAVVGKPTTIELHSGLLSIDWYTIEE